MTLLRNHHPQPRLSSASAPITKLPDDLLEKMFAALVERESEADLSDCSRRCALVCRAWAGVCRKYIFYSVTVSVDTGKDSESRVWAFRSLVQERESIVGEVKCLRYEVGVDAPDDEDVEMHGSGTDSGSDLDSEESAPGSLLNAEGDSDSDSDSSDLVLVLSLLANQSVRTFTLDFVDTEAPELENKQPWCHIPECLVDTLTAFIRTSPLVRLELKHISGLPAVYLGPKGWLKPTLTELSLGWVTLREPEGHEIARLEEVIENEAFDRVMSEWVELPGGDDDDEAPASPGTQIPRLGYFGAAACDFAGLVVLLRLYWTREKVDGRPLLLDFTGLKELKIARCEPGVIMEFLQYVLRSTQCLEVLYLEGYTDSFDYIGLLTTTLSPSCLQTLSHMDIHLFLCGPTDDPYLHFAEELFRFQSLGRTAPYTSEPQSVHVAPPAPVKLGLKKLRINIRNMFLRLLNTELAAWSQLDEVLSGSSTAPGGAFSALEEVAVSVQLTFAPGKEPVGLRQGLEWIGEKAFPRLRASREVEFDFVVEEEE